MWKQVRRQIFGTQPPSTLQETLLVTQPAGSVHSLERTNTLVAHAPRRIARLDRSRSLPEPELREQRRAPEWYQCLTHVEKHMLQRLVLNLNTQGHSFKMIVRIVSQRFNIGDRLSREVVAWRRKEDALRYGIKPKITAELDVKSPSPNTFKRIGSPRKISRKPEQHNVKISIWEKEVLTNKHSYKDEVYERLLKEERRQATVWHIVREGAAKLDTFAPKRQMCIESMTNFSVKYKLKPKTTEASFIQLYRFLLMPKSQRIVKPSSGVKGAVGSYPLIVVAICILMISAKYEEIYPPALSAFAEHVQSTALDLVRLEIKLLSTMKWNLVTSTPVDFLGRFFEAVGTAIKTNFLAMFILESS